MGYEAIPFPTGQTPAALYAHASNLSTQLRRILKEVSGPIADLTALEADVADLDARVAILEAAGGAGLTPQQQFELSLTTATSEVLGGFGHLLERLQTVQEQEADAVLLATIQAHKANTGVNTEVRVRAEETLALAQRIDTADAALGVTNANVTALTTAVATGDSALASQINSLSSTVAGNTASIQILTQSVDGYSTRFAVMMSAQNEVIGFISLDGDVQGSSFTVAADYFKVSKIGTTGGTAVPVFSMQTVGGVPKLALRGDMNADGSIIARHIAAGSITADKIDVTSLSALTANLGTVTAGLIQNVAATLKFDLPNMRLYRTDGTMELNFNSKLFTIDI